MKTLFTLLLCFGFAFSAGSALANPVDPSVIINKGSADAITFSTNSLSNPLVIELTNGFASSLNFQYIGTKPLTELFVLLDGALPGEQFFCVSNIFSGCGGFNPLNNDGDDVGLIFTKGTITPGEEISAAVSAPEPGTLLLLATGGLLLIGLARKW